MQKSYDVETNARRAQSIALSRRNKLTIYELHSDDPSIDCFRGNFHEVADLLNWHAAHDYCCKYWLEGFLTLPSKFGTITVSVFVQFRTQEEIDSERSSITRSKALRKLTPEWIINGDGPFTLLDFDQYNNCNLYSHWYQHNKPVKFTCKTRDGRIYNVQHI